MRNILGIGRGGNRESGRRRRAGHLVPASVEPLEGRALFAATAFAVDPARSHLTVSATSGGAGTFEEQAPGSLTTSLSGTLSADVAPDTITLAADAAIPAAVNGSWVPNSDLGPFSPAEPGNFGGKLDVYNEFVAARGLVFGLGSGHLPLAADGTFPADQIEVTSAAGTVYYGGGVAKGTYSVAGLVGTNQSSTAARYAVAGGAATITIPVEASYTQTIAVNPFLSISLTLTYTGTVVATATVSPVVPAVQAVQVGDGSAQRSTVKSLTVSFNTGVSLDAGAFALAGRNGAGAGAGTTVSAANPSGDKKTWVLSFAGPPVVSGSLADGVYDLTVVGTKVHAGAATGPTMAGSSTTTFHRLFGDQDGNKTVNNADYVRFRSAFGSTTGGTAYNALFDVDGNGTINNADYVQFRNRFGTTLAYA